MTCDVASGGIATPEPVVTIRRSAALFSLFAFLWGLFLLWAVYLAFSYPGTVLDFRPNHLALLAVLIGLIWMVADRRPILILDAQGVRDRRRGSALLPWSDMVRVEALAYGLFWRGGQVGFRLHFRRSVQCRSLGQWYSTGDVYIRMQCLDIEPAQFVEYVKRFAPHVVLDTKMLEVR